MLMAEFAHCPNLLLFQIFRRIISLFRVLCQAPETTNPLLDDELNRERISYDGGTRDPGSGTGPLCIPAVTLLYVVASTLSVCRGHNTRFVIGLIGMVSRGFDPATMLASW